MPCFYLSIFKLTDINTTVKLLSRLLSFLWYHITVLMPGFCILALSSTVFDPTLSQLAVINKLCVFLMCRYLERVDEPGMLQLNLAVHNPNSAAKKEKLLQKRHLILHCLRYWSDLHLNPMHVIRKVWLTSQRVCLLLLEFQRSLWRWKEKANLQVDWIDFSSI